MSKKETKSSNGSLNISELNTIRDILMGQQINEFENRLNELQERIEDLESQLESHAKAATKANADSAHKFETMLNNKMTSMDKKVDKQSEKLSGRLDRTSKADKELIGKYLADLGQKLMSTK